MPVIMDPVQLAFWRELLGPFRDDELSFVSRGGKNLTYIDKRALENRLDSACGPHGWYAEYRDAGRGLICRLFIEVPLKQGWGWMHKEDGGGAEGMVKKAGVEDEDNDFKSEFTNAFRRAAQDAWGIGRYLYNKGIPSFLDPNAEAGPARVEPPKDPRPELPRREVTQRPRDASAINESPVTPASKPGPVKPAFDPEYFRLPKPGKAWAWCKAMEAAFEVQLSRGMTEEATRLGFTTQFNDWNEIQTIAVCMSAIRHIATLRSYKGQFAELLASDAGPAATPKPATLGINIADLRKEIMTKITALITRQTGRKAELAEMKAMFLEVAPQCKTQGGNTGEVPESLAGTTDPAWLKNIIAFIDQQIEHVAIAAPTATEAADCPF